MTMLKGLALITLLRRNMKPRLMRLWDRLLLRKRFLIETINDQLKNVSQIEHSRHRLARFERVGLKDFEEFVHISHYLSSGLRSLNSTPVTVEAATIIPINSGAAPRLSAKRGSTGLRAIW